MPAAGKTPPEAECGDGNYLGHGTKAQAPMLGDESSLYGPTISNTRSPTQSAW
jgi:hypothetical protein